MGAAVGVPGGFDLVAARHIGKFDRAPDVDVLDVITGLVDKSLLSRQNGTFGRGAWYRMLETVREYGAGKLAERGDGEDVWARQVEYYVALAAIPARRVRATAAGVGRAAAA